MGRSSPPLEGVVVIVIDAPEAAKHIEKAFGNAGATTFVARDDDECRALLQRISPHFAIVDPSVSGGGPQSMAWTLLSHPECRTVIYSSNVHCPTGVATRWLVSKSRPVSDVIDVVTGALKDSTWIAKGGDDVKPARREVHGSTHMILQRGSACSYSAPGVKTRHEIATTGSTIVSDGRESARTAGHA